MSEREPELDESLRGKLLSLGENVDAPFDPESERRIVARLQWEAAQRQDRNKRVRVWAAATGVLATAAAVLFVWLGRAPRDAQVQPTQVCAWGESALTFVARSDGTRELALGPAGHIVLAAGAEAFAKQGAACALGVTLVRGSLAAELGNLRPGSLRVQTSLGDVQVRGTTFAVDLEDGLHVVLLSGAVELVDDGDVALTMPPGKSLRRAARRAAPSLSEASADDARLVSNLLRPAKREPRSSDAHLKPEANAATRSDESARATPAERATGLLGEAEAARRQGDTQRARTLYGRAEQASHADAEVALLRHAGFEIEKSNPAIADKLLAEHRRRFPRSRLFAEAAWLGVRSLQAGGDQNATRIAAQKLVNDFAGTPQARAAQRLLEHP